MALKTVPQQRGPGVTPEESMRLLGQRIVADPESVSFNLVRSYMDMAAGLDNSSSGKDLSRFGIKRDGEDLVLSDGNILGLLSRSSDPHLADLNGIVRHPDGRVLPMRDEGEAAFAPKEMVQRRIDRMNSVSEQDELRISQSELIGGRLAAEGLGQNDLLDFAKGMYMGDDLSENAEKAGEIAREVLQTRKNYVGYENGSQLDEDDKTELGLLSKVVSDISRSRASEAANPVVEEPGKLSVVRQPELSALEASRDVEVQQESQPAIDFEKKGISTALDVMSGKYAHMGEGHKGNSRAAPQIEALRGLYSEEELASRMQELLRANEGIIRGMSHFHIGYAGDWSGDPTQAEKTEIWDTFTEPEKKVLRSNQEANVHRPEQGVTFMLFELGNQKDHYADWHRSRPV